MPNVFFGLFKKVIAVSTIELVAQLSAGVTYFKYVILGTDSTETEGVNSVSTKKKNWKAVNWTAPDGRIVTTLYWFGNGADAATEEPPAFIAGYPTAPLEPSKVLVLVDGYYVAWLIDNNSAPAHIQTIDNIDYIVSYLADSSAIKKYMVILDMNINMNSVTYIPKVDTFYLSGAPVSALRPVNPFGSFEDTGETIDAAKILEGRTYYTMHERQLVSNADGSRTIFALSRELDGRYKAYPIFEITDDNTGFSVTEINEFINVYEADEGADSTYKTQTGSRINYADSLVDQDYCQSSGGAVKLIHHGTLSGSASGTKGITAKGKRSKYFLGCAYNRKTDQPIILYLEYGEKEYVYDVITSMSFSGALDWIDTDSPTSNTAHRTASTTLTANGVNGSNQLFELFISDTNGANPSLVIETGLSSATATGTELTNDFWSGYYRGISGDVPGDDDYDYDFTLDYKPVMDFNVISLANLSFVYKKNELSGVDNYIYNGFPTVSHDVIASVGSKSTWDTSEKLYIIVDGVETLMSDTVSTMENIIVTTYGFSFDAALVNEFIPNSDIQTCDTNTYQEWTGTKTY